ncbi:phosphonate transport system substrate-binding protein [Mycoplasma testudineum]|uniref:Phosphonate transport system substrate-binding protein n=1 Tax=Mycoplasma testudineum TaxID=244584 RepID=A0A4V3C2W4_9MOLU|nr:hypothetical protein [Mycoplasma testudineum]OYD26733.1 hypothetical protein CG473_02145 [Mycoplasma testudineum]TDO19869.1 phosphonate transport system substrate-binding protein [Mycoplasma testudineum]
MNKIKRILSSMLGIGILVTSATVAISCAQEVQRSDNFELSTKWFVAKLGTEAITNYEKVFNEKYDQLKSENASKYPNAINISMKVVSNDNSDARLQNVLTGKSGMTITNVANVINLNNPNITVGAQILTRAFKNDTTIKYYSDSDGPKYLSETAITETNELLKNTPFQSWDDVKQKWDGAKYEFLYSDPNDKINFYRGMILISGTDAIIRDIKDAWNTKNFEKFISYGIIHGKISSQGKYKLQDKLLRDHFGKGINEIPGDLRIQDSEKLNLIGSDNKYRIAFDDMYSFAWQNNSDGNVKKDIFKTKDNEYLQVLSLTNPLLYDVLIFNNKILNADTINLIIDTFISLSIDNTTDTYGIYNGYNGYKKIDNFNDEIVIPFNKAL